ncbi:MAG: TRAP transporter small permease [Lachnospiraceae bacterium]|nr:TRAP transporter small permease [Lachnospiraceae bacterium]
MSKFDKILDKTTLIIASIAFSAMIVITTFNVFARFLFMKSFAWSEELTYMCFNWAVFFGICNVYNSQGLISIDSLVIRLPKDVQRKFAIVTFAIVALLNVALTIWGWRLTFGAWQRKTANLMIPYTFIDMCLPISTMIICYYAIRNMIKEIKGQHVEEASLDQRV